MNKKFVALLIIGYVIYISLAIPGSYPAVSEGIDILFEFPDGTVAWYHTNYTDFKNATIDACKHLGFTYSFLSSQYAIINGYRLTRYEWNGEWIIENESITSNIMAYSAGIPLATPENRYPRFTAIAQSTYYAPGDEELWNMSTGTTFSGIDSTVVGFDNQIFFESWSGLYSMSLNGTLIWKNATIYGMSTPYVYNDTLFVGSADGYLYAVSINSTVIWREKICSSPGYVGLTSAPLVVNDTLYIASYESDNSTPYLYALSLNGTQMWNMSLSGSMYFSTFAYNNNTLYIPIAGNYNGTWYPPYGILAVDISTHTIKWFFNTSGGVRSTPLLHNNTLYFSCTDGYLYAISTEGNLRWKTKIGYSTSSPNYMDGVIYVGSGSFSGNGKIYAIYENGTVKWNATVAGGVQSSITFGGPFIYFSANAPNGKIYCFDKNGSEVWNFTVGNYLLSSPSIVGNLLFFGDDDGVLHCLKDTVPPSVVMNGSDTYIYGETVSLSFIARDNMGVRRIALHFMNMSLISDDSINLEFIADFTGVSWINVSAEDYDGNLITRTFKIYVSPATMKVSITGPIEIENGTTANYTVKVVDESGGLVDDVNLTIFVDGVKQKCDMAKNGYYTFSIFFNSTGNHTVSVLATKYGYRNTTAMLDVYVYSTQHSNTMESVLIYYWYFIAGFVAFVSILIGVILVIKHRKTRDLLHEKLKNQ